jgi:hypothetical protein
MDLPVRHSTRCNMRVRRLRRATMLVLVAAALTAGCGGTPWSRAGSALSVGPFIYDPANPTKADTHWHAALGVYECDHWLGDSSGIGVWQWPNATLEGHPARASDPSRYAGLHSHDDGVIHMEPVTSDEAGWNATLGKYFEFGGWHVSADGFDFLGVQVKNGDGCNGVPGKLSWKVARWNGTLGRQHYTVERGDPGQFKLYNADVVVVAFLPAGSATSVTGDPPSLVNLPGVLGVAPRPEFTVPPVRTASFYSSGWSRR